MPPKQWPPAAAYPRRIPNIPSPSVCTPTHTKSSPPSSRPSRTVGCGADAGDGHRRAGDRAQGKRSGAIANTRRDGATSEPAGPAPHDVARGPYAPTSTRPCGRAQDTGTDSARTDSEIPRSHRASSAAESNACARSSAAPPSTRRSLDQPPLARPSHRLAAPTVAGIDKYEQITSGAPRGSRGHPQAHITARYPAHACVCVLQLRYACVYDCGRAYDLSRPRPQKQGAQACARKVGVQKKEVCAGRQCRWPAPAISAQLKNGARDTPAQL
ncbi:hypothetical protein C8J57DRAFT_1503634 [Mycena rebaudengoi]|nr:hypothetical protein C8J57DRAFT_1503634 [Mycena rebaudengoi]